MELHKFLANTKKANAQSEFLRQNLNSLLFLIDSIKDDLDLDKVFYTMGSQFSKLGISILITVSDQHRELLVLRHNFSADEDVLSIFKQLSLKAHNNKINLYDLYFNNCQAVLLKQETVFCRRRLKMLSDRLGGGNKDELKKYESIVSPMVLKGETLGYVEFISKELENEQLEIFHNFTKALVESIANTILYKEAKESEERYQDLFENSSEGFFILEIAKKKFTDVNRAMSEISGYTKDELKQMNFFLLFSKNERKVINKQIEIIRQERKQEKTDLNFETKIVTKKGEKKPVLIKIARITDNNEWFVILVDITEGKMNEKKLQESEEKYRKLVDNANDLVIILNKKGILEYANNFIFTMSGYVQDEVIGKYFLTFVHEEDRLIVGEILKRKITQIDEIGRNYEFRFITKANIIKTISFSAVLIEKNGKISGLQAIIRDITIEKNLQDKIQKAKMHYESVIDTIQDSLCVIDKNFKIVSFNKSFIDKVGLSPAEIKNKKCFEIIPLYDDGGIVNVCNCPGGKNNCRMHSVFKTKQTLIIQKKHQIDDITRYYEISIYPTKGSDGEVYQIVMSIVDVTKVKLADEEIKSLQEFQKKILDNIPVSIIVLNKDGYVVSLNAYAEKMVSPSMIGKRLSEAKEIKSNKKLFNLYKLLLDRGGLFYFENLSYIKSKNNEKKYLNIIAVPLYDAAKNIEGAISMAINNTEAMLAKNKLEDLNKNLEATVLNRTKELNEVNQKLNKALELKSKFISDASHELRTPLTIIQGNLDLAVKEVEFLKDQEIPEVYEIIQHEISQISGILTDLTMLTNIDSLAESINYEKVDMVKIMHDSIQSLKIMADQKNITLNNKIKFKKAYILGDEAKIERAIINIIRNAINYNNIGGWVSVDLEKKEKGVCISISDSGIGIPTKDLPFIFERFYRVDKARSRSEGGTGLGLSICKWIVDAHGGSINITSKEAVGTTFTLCLPRGK